MDQRNRRLWWYNIGIWSVVAVFTTTQLYLKARQGGGSSSWWGIFGVQLLVWWVWALITPAIFWLGRKFRIDRGRIANGVLIHLPVSIAIVLAYLALYTSIWLIFGQTGLDWEAFSSIYAVLFVNLFHWHFFIYVAIIGMVHAYLYYRTSEEERLRGVELEKELLASQLRMLKMQLQPHFLFNTLNSIVSAIHQEKPQVASVMTTGLSELLRIALTDNERAVVPLVRELHYVRTYLDIEQQRFKTLIVSYDIDKTALDIEVPNFFLQPLVENAIKHGIAQSTDARRLEVSIQLADQDNLLIRIYNQGPKLERLDGGIGLDNVRKRLHAHYQEEAKLSLRNATDGVIAEVQLPAL
ncbi:MAG: histidine kinase [Bacteroidota bacterium]